MKFQSTFIGIINCDRPVFRIREIEMKNDPGLDSLRFGQLSSVNLRILLEANLRRNRKEIAKKNAPRFLHLTGSKLACAHHLLQPIVIYDFDYSNLRLGDAFRQIEQRCNCAKSAPLVLTGLAHPHGQAALKTTALAGRTVFLVDNTVAIVFAFAECAHVIVGSTEERLMQEEKDGS